MSYDDDMTIARYAHEDEVERINRQHERTEDRLIQEISDLKRQLSDTELEIVELRATNAQLRATVDHYYG